MSTWRQDLDSSDLCAGSCKEQTAVVGQDVGRWQGSGQVSHQQAALGLRNVFGCAELDEILVELCSQVESMAEEVITKFGTSAYGVSGVSDYRPLVCCSYTHTPPICDHLAPSLCDSSEGCLVTYSFCYFGGDQGMAYE